MKKKITITELKYLIKEIIKEEDSVSLTFNTDNVGEDGEKKLENVTNKPFFNHLKTFIAKKSVNQQVDLVLAIINELALGEDFYVRFRSRIVSNR